jgi:hypothetical protein
MNNHFQQKKSRTHHPETWLPSLGCEIISADFSAHSLQIEKARTNFAGGFRTHLSFFPSLIYTGRRSNAKYLNTFCFVSSVLLLAFYFQNSVFQKNDRKKSW